MRTRRRKCKCGHTTFYSPFKGCSSCKLCNTNYLKKKPRRHTFKYVTIRPFESYAYCAKCGHIEVKSLRAKVKFVDVNTWEQLEELIKR